MGLLKGWVCRLVHNTSTSQVAIKLTAWCPQPETAAAVYRKGPCSSSFTGLVGKLMALFVTAAAITAASAMVCYR
jgi:hypothetical protein